MVRSSGQHKCALAFCATLLLVLGGGIIVSGFIYDFRDPYDIFSEPELYFHTHTQYWLGIPLFILGLYVFLTITCKSKCPIVLGLVLASLLLVLSICAVILQGPAWRILLQLVLRKNKSCENKSSNISCEEMRYLTVINSIITIFSALAIVICQFCCFIYCRILGWMSHIRYDDPIDDYYAKSVGNRYINGHHGRANEVALSTIH